MTPQEFMDMFGVKINQLEEAQRVASMKRQNIQAMITADYNGLTCIVDKCYSKAEVVGSRESFCGKHTLIAVA